MLHKNFVYIKIKQQLYCMVCYILASIIYTYSGIPPIMTTQKIKTFVRLDHQYISLAKNNFFKSYVSTPIFRYHDRESRIHMVQGEGGDVGGRE